MLGNRLVAAQFGIFLNSNHVPFNGTEEATMTKVSAAFDAWKCYWRREQSGVPVRMKSIPFVDRLGKCPHAML